MAEKANESIRTICLERLRKDWRFAHLPKEQQKALIEQSIQFGEEKARQIKAALLRVNGETLHCLCAQRGVQVVNLETKYDLPYIAEYGDDEKGE